MMPRLPIAPGGPEFSRMVYGTWQLLSNEPTQQEINRRLHVAGNWASQPSTRRKSTAFTRSSMRWARRWLFRRAFATSWRSSPRRASTFPASITPTAAPRITTLGATACGRAWKNRYGCWARTVSNCCSSTGPTGSRRRTTRPPG